MCPSAIALASRISRGLNWLAGFWSRYVHTGRIWMSLSTVPQPLSWGGTLSTFPSLGFYPLLTNMSCLCFSYSPRMGKAWRTSARILRSWLNVYMTTWPNVSTSVPSPPSPWKWSHSRCLRSTFWLKAARLWREPTMIWVSLLLFPSFLLPPSLLHSITYFLRSLLSYLSLLLQFQWVLCVCCSA